MLSPGTMLCWRFSRTDSPRVTETLDFLTHTSHFLLPSPSPFYSLLLWVTALDSSYKWDHAVFVFLGLAYFTEHNVLQVHSCCCKCQNFLLFSSWIIFNNNNNIQLYIYIHIYTHTPCVCVCVCVKKKKKSMVLIWIQLLFSSKSENWELLRELIYFSFFAVQTDNPKDSHLFVAGTIKVCFVGNYIHWKLPVVVCLLAYLYNVVLQKQRVKIQCCGCTIGKAAARR